jgi:hypothetical protein
MKCKVIYVAVFFSLSICRLVSGQDTITTLSRPSQDKLLSIYGFIRGGAYYDLNRAGSDPYFSSGFSDLGIKIEYERPAAYKAFADIRFRYGAEFGKQVSSIFMREGFLELNRPEWSLTMGQQILKWGRADFTNPTSKFNPQNMISRSPDREDMDMGNLLATFKWYPSEIISFQAVAEPYYRPSVLIIDPVPLPENTSLKQMNGLVTDQQLSGFGLRTDIHLRGIDFGISWFDGYDPMPGIALDEFSLIMTGPAPVFTTALSERPYKMQVLGFDFESAIGQFGIRGEAAWSVPKLSYTDYEYVPLEEIKWVAGLDWSSGKWRFTGEYSGKFIPEFQPAEVDPIIGTQPDFAKLAEMMATPGFDISEYVRQQVGSFNRLYNYQLCKFYHSAGLKVETDLLYERLIPSVFTMYNITSGDLILIPEIRYKPWDGFSVVAGAEIYSGKNGSLFDIVDDFMNSIYVGLRVDF